MTIQNFNNTLVIQSNPDKVLAIVHVRQGIPPFKAKVRILRERGIYPAMTLSGFNCNILQDESGHDLKTTEEEVSKIAGMIRTNDNLSLMVSSLHKKPQAICIRKNYCSVGLITNSPRIFHKPSSCYSKILDRL